MVLVVLVELAEPSLAAQPVEDPLLVVRVPVYVCHVRTLLKRRSRNEFEYELLDTGVFNDDRYFDVFVEYAKAGPDDVLVRITAANRGPNTAELHLLPTLWFRNTWSWGEDDRKPGLREAEPGVIHASHHELGEYWLYCDGGPELLFTENNTNRWRLYGAPNEAPYVKDGINDYLVHVAVRDTDHLRRLVLDAFEAALRTDTYRVVVNP